MGKVTFALTTGSPSTWEIAQRNVMAVKPGTGEKKFINYFKGESSVFVEDITNKDIKPGRVPIFKFNVATKKTQLVVDDTDVNLMNYLRIHPDYGKKYAEYSKKIEAQKKLSGYEKVEKALDLIKGSDEILVKGTAIAVLGYSYYGAEDEVCVAALKEKAFNNPEVIINTMTAPDYQSRYIASVAFIKGILKNNITNTAVVWGDNEGIIIHVAKGENGIDKLTEFLSNPSAESTTVLQEIQARVDKNQTVKAAPVSDAAKDKKIAELEAKLAALTEIKVNDPVTEPGNLTPEEQLAKDIAEAQAAYKAKTGNDVPIRFKNDLEWIKGKLEE